jgi:deoxyribonuclease (pyrimidine dimer)
MVRVNIIDPKYLADQHLIAEYNEILMLASYIKKYPLTDQNKNKIPKRYCLGKGHMLFFKDKPKYLEQRHNQLKKEMLRRGFIPKKTLIFPKKCKNFDKSYSPSKKDKEVIKKRLLQKIKLKPGFYRYYQEKQNQKFFCDLIKTA